METTDMLCESAEQAAEHLQVRSRIDDDLSGRALREVCHRRGVHLQRADSPHLFVHQVAMLEG